MLIRWKNWLIRTFHNLSLRQKLSLAFLVMTLAPLLLATSLAEHRAEQSMREFVFERNKNSAMDIAHNLDEMFQNKIRLLKIMATTSEVQSLDPGHLTSLLELVVGQYPELQIAVVADISGRQVARSDGMPVDGTVYYDDRDYFQQVRRTGTTAISDVVASKSLGTLGIAIAEPIRDNTGKMIGMLIFDLGLDNLKWYFNHVELGDHGYAYAVNRQGRVIIHPNQSHMEAGADVSERAAAIQAAAGFTGWLEYNNNGLEILAGYSHIPSVSWGLVVEQTLHFAMADIASLRRTNHTILLIAAVLAILLSLGTAKYIAGAIANLSAATVRLAEGDLQTRLQMNRNDELGQLAANFNRMAAQLARRSEALRLSEQKFRSLVDNINIGIYRVAVDGKGKFLQVNPRMAEIFGFASPTEMLGVQAESVYVDIVDREEFLADIQREGFIKNRESLMRRRDGTVFWCSRSGVLRQDDEGKNWIDGVLEDIDDRKQAERQLHQAKEELERQVAERTRELTAVNLELQRLSLSDGLTCIGNRRYLDEFLEREWRRAMRDRTPLAVLMLDIDYFKLYNDTYGHLAGDECLKRVAGVLRDSIQRTTDFVSRYGGEEFVVVLPATNEHGALTVAEKLRRGVSDLAIPHGLSPLGGIVTVSIGVAVAVPTPETDAATLLTAADRALYQAKAAGRNQVGSTGELLT